MPEAYPPSSVDSRTFGNLVQSVLDDLHRPDLQNLVPRYVRAAIDFYARQPFFFTQIENTPITQGWQPNLYCPVGTSFYDIASDNKYYIFVAVQAGISGMSKPLLTPNIFISPGPPIFNTGQSGTTVDNGVVWATAKAWPQSTTSVPAKSYWSQLSTVPYLNQYVPPVDYTSPYLIEITWAGLRTPLIKISYPELRNMDLIRPAPVSTFPVNWAWYQQQIYIWPYPADFFPLTLSYYSAPFPPTQATDTNWWTTIAEALIRAYTRARINLEVIRDTDAYQADMQAAKDEFISLRVKEMSQQDLLIPSDVW
jgi:hypothetical protein